MLWPRLPSLGGIRNAARAISDRSELVKIEPGKLGPFGVSLEATMGIDSDRLDPASWYLDSPAASAAFVLVVDCLNFGSGYFKDLAKDSSDSGYLTMAGGLVRYFDSHWPFAPSHLNSLGPLEMLGILQQRDPFSERLMQFAELLAKAASQLGTFLADNYRDSFAYFFAAIAQSSEALISELARLSFYQDGYRWKGILFQPAKKAQITASDLALVATHHRGLGTEMGIFDFPSSRSLTAFADNSLPHVLSTDGVLVYSDALAAHIAKGEELAYGSPAEIEIRAATITAIDDLAWALTQRWRRQVTAAETDAMVWRKKHLPSQRARYRATRSHKTRSVFY